MGTTRTAITTDAGVELCFVLMIEGYDTLITSHSDTSAVVDAYQTTEWDTAISGLNTPEDYTEKMELFTGKLDAPGMRFVVSPDAADTFGKLIHKTSNSSGKETYLAESIDPEDGPILVDSAADFPSSGTIWIGTECIVYTSKSGNYLGTSPNNTFRGKWAPFKSAGETEQRFGRSHNLTQIQGVSHKPKVTDYPRIWAGKYVRCMVHRVRTIDGSATLDDFTEADTIFAGVLENVSDSESGNTILDCVHVNKLINDSLLLRDQYVGTVKPGIYLSAGDGTTTSTAMQYRYYEHWQVAVTLRAANPLTVVSGAAAHAGEVQEGYKSYDELLDILNAWLHYEFESGRIDMVASFERHALESGDTRTRVNLGGVTLGTADYAITKFWGSSTVTKFLGWGDNEWFGPSTAPHSTTPTGSLVSPQSPLRSMAFQQTGTSEDEDEEELPYTRLDIINPSGTWAEIPAADVPDGFEASTGDWGFLKVGDVIIQGKYDSANERFTNLRIPDSAIGAFLGVSNIGRTKKDLELYGQTTIGATSGVEVRQVVILQNDLVLLFAKMFYSTGSADYNNGAYDTLPEQVSVGLPSEIMGSSLLTGGGFIEALSDLQSVTEAGDLTVMLDKPTRFGEVLNPELLLRGGNIRYKDGSLGIGIASTPGSSTDHTLTTASKAGDARADDPNRTRSTRTSRLIRDKITLNYNRALDGKYRSNASVVNAVAISDHGGLTNPITVNARNTTGGDQQTNATVDAQLVELASYAFGMFSHELTEVRLSISRKHFHMSPGDSVSLTDDSVRNPLTGNRGITSYPCWVEGISRNWATGIGEVQLIMLGLVDPDRYGIYSPSAGVDSYDTGTGVATVLEHAFSLGGDDDDVTHFAAGDVVRFIEVSPSDPSSPSTWTDTIDSISSNDVTTVNNNGNGTYNSALNYVMISIDRTNAGATQQTDAYYADDSDGQVQDEANSYLWARAPFTLDLTYSTNTGSLALDATYDESLILTDGNQTGMDNIDKMTIGLFVRFDTLRSDENYFVTKWVTGVSTTNKSYIFMFDEGTNELHLSTYTAGGLDEYTESWTPELCRWYHVCVVWDGVGGTYEFFVDGASIGSGAATTGTIADSTAPVRIGGIGTSSFGQDYDGDIDSVEFWNVARTEAEIARDIYTERDGTETGLVTYLPFNEDYTDRTSNDNDFSELAGGM